MATRAARRTSVGRSQKAIVADMETSGGERESQGRALAPGGPARSGGRVEVVIGRPGQLRVVPGVPAHEQPRLVLPQGVQAVAVLAVAPLGEPQAIAARF